MWVRLLLVICLLIVPGLFMDEQPRNMDNVIQNKKGLKGKIVSTLMSNPNSQLKYASFSGLLRFTIKKIDSLKSAAKLRQKNAGQSSILDLFSRI